jgi:hypothetical protein
LTDTEHSEVMEAALNILKDEGASLPLVVDIVDKHYLGKGKRLGEVGREGGREGGRAGGMGESLTPTSLTAAPPHPSPRPSGNSKPSCRRGMRLLT